MAYCIALLCLGSAIVGTHAGRLYEMHSWKYVDYLWNSPAQKQNAIDSGDYITNSNIPFDVDQAPGTQETKMSGSTYFRNFEDKVMFNISF